MARALAFSLFLVLAATAFADFAADRKAAADLMAAGKYEEAMAAFMVLTAGDTTEAQKSDVLEQAALCAIRLKQLDKAMELARQIPVATASKLCQLRVLAAGVKWNDVVALLKDEDLTTWPDAARFDALFLRGQAYVQLKDAAAETDLRAVAEGHPNNWTKGEASLKLGDLYRDQLADEAKALEAYAKAADFVSRRGWLACTAIRSASMILRKQEKYDEAMKEIQKIDGSQIVGYWRVAFASEAAEILVGQGKKEEAIAKLEATIADEAVPADLKNDMKRRLDQLKAQ